MPVDPRLMGLAGAGAGATAGMGSRATGGLMGALDAPRRSVAGALMAALGGAPGAMDEETGEQMPGREGSVLPALLGLGVGGASMLIPGMQPFAPWLGAAAAGLGQMGGEQAGLTDAFDPGEVTGAMGMGDDPLTGMLAGAAMDPLTYLGALGGGKAGMAMNRPIPESPFLQAKNAFRGLLPEARGAGLPAAQAEEKLLARVLGDMQAPRPGPTPVPASLTGPSPMPSFAGELSARPLGPGMQRVQEASMAGYNPEVQGFMPSLEQAAMGGGGKSYKLVNQQVGGPAEALGWMGPQGPGGRPLAAQGLPPWAEVRGGRVLPRAGAQVPPVADYADTMNDPAALILEELLQQPSGAQLRQAILQNMQRMNATPIP